jgi:hypothetical protein
MRFGNLFSGGMNRGLLVFGVMLAAASSVQAKTRWVEGSFGQLPSRAIVGGHEANGDALFICRAPYKGGYHPGKIRAAFRGCNIGYGGKEITINPYDVLIEVGQ